MEAVSSQKRELVELANDGPLCATHGSHAVVTSAQLHHFGATRLRLSTSGHFWLGDYGEPDRNPNVYS